MDEDKSSSSQTDRRHQKTKKVLIGGVNLDSIKQKEPQQSKLQTKVNLVEPDKATAQEDESALRDSRLMSSIYGSRHLGSSFTSSQLSNNSPMKRGNQNYDKIVHSQKQHSLARLNNHENLESSPDEDFYEDSPVQVRELHNQYPYGGSSMRPFDLLHAQIHQQQQQQSVISTSSNFSSLNTGGGGIGFMGSQIHQNHQKSTPYSKGVKKQHTNHPQIAAQNGIAQQTLQSNKFSGQLFHYAKTQYKMKLMTATTYNQFPQQSSSATNAYQFVQPIPIELIEDPSLDNENLFGGGGGGGPPSLITPSQGQTKHESLLRQHATKSALDDISTAHPLMKKSDRNSSQTLPTSLSQKKAAMLSQAPPYQQMTPNTYQQKHKLGTQPYFGPANENLSAQQTMVPNIGPNHIQLSGAHSTALGWKQYQQIAYPNGSGGNVSTMPASQMSKYTGAQHSNGSNFPDINNPQPTTAPGGKRSGRINIGQRNDVGPNPFLQGPPPQSYEISSGPQQAANGQIIIPGTVNTLILDQKGNATFYNNSPDIQQIKAQQIQKLINTDSKRKDRILLNKSQLRDGRPNNGENNLISSSKKGQNGQILIPPPPPFSKMSNHQPQQQINNVIAHSNQSQNGNYKRSDTAINQCQSSNNKNVANSIDNFATTLNQMTSSFTRRPNIGSHMSMGAQN